MISNLHIWQFLGKWNQTLYIFLNFYITIKIEIGLPVPTQGIFPTQGSSMSPAAPAPAGIFFSTVSPEKPPPWAQDWLPHGSQWHLRSSLEMGPNCKFHLHLFSVWSNFHFLNKVTYLNLHPRSLRYFMMTFFVCLTYKKCTCFIPSHFIKPLIYSLFPNTLCLSIFFLLKSNSKQTTFFEVAV